LILIIKSCRSTSTQNTKRSLISVITLDCMGRAVRIVQFEKGVARVLFDIWFDIISSWRGAQAHHEFVHVERGLTRHDTTIQEMGS
jgi:hypothetical protein